MHRFHFLIVLVALFFLAVPALAQDVPNATPTLVSSVEPTAAPPVVATQPPIIIVQQPSPVSEPAPLQTDLWIILGAVGVLILLVIRIAELIIQRAPASTIDGEVVGRLSAVQDNRELMDRLERAYQNAGRQQQAALDTVAQALRFLAPMTPIQADDKFAGLLADIQTPGAPPSPPVSPQG